MDRRAFLGALAGSVLAAPLAAEAQKSTKIWRIGLLTSGSREGAGADVRIVPFSQGLRELGYVEGRNVIVETRCAEGRVERFPALAAELVDLKIDVLVAMSTPGALAAKQATSTIPIVMAAVGEPVEMKPVESLAHPGGNITGLSLSAPQLAAKRLDLLKQALPKLSRVTVLWNSANQGMQTRFQETQRGAHLLGVAIHSIAIQSPDDFDPVFGAMMKDRPESLLVLADTVTVANRQRAIEFAARNRVPAIYEIRAFAEDGGLMSYGIDMSDHDRRAAVYVDKILKGAKPSDLPAEEPTKFELVINLKTAHALGLTMPVSLLQRADQIIQQWSRRVERELPGTSSQRDRLSAEATIPFCRGVVPERMLVLDPAVPTVDNDLPGGCGFRVLGGPAHCFVFILEHLADAAFPGSTRHFPASAGETWKTCRCAM